MLPLDLFSNRSPKDVYHVYVVAIYQIYMVAQILLYKILYYQWLSPDENIISLAAK